MYQRLKNFVVTNDLLCDEQNAYRSDRSCIDHLYCLTTVVRNRLRQKISTYVCYVDFVRAFDSVNRDLLWYKLENKGINGKFLNILQSMYNKTSATVRINSNHTDKFHTVYGIRQGDVLAPILFALFVNDIAESVKSTGLGVEVGDGRLPLLMYADDIILIASSPKDLQEMLDALYLWCNKWRLEVNVSKTKIMHFPKRNCEQCEKIFKFGEESVEFCTHYKYLGLELNDMLDFSETVNVLCKSGSRALGSLIAKYYACDGLPLSVYKHLYESLVCPVVDYSCALWATKNYAQCDTLQHRAMRTFLGVNKVAPVAFMYGDLAWIPPHIRQQIVCIKFWYRLCNMDKSRLLYKVFNEDFTNSMLGYKSWCTDMKKILYLCQLDDVYLTRDVSMFSSQSLCDKVENVLLSNYQTKWQNILTEYSQLEIYRTIKSDYRQEDYVISCVNHFHRSTFAKLRMGIYPIRMETGRYRSIPRNERLCKSCDALQVEDTEHFLLNCSKHSILRTELYETINTKLNIDLDAFDNRMKLVFLLTNCKIAVDTANFAIRAFNNR